jgi:cytochrome P450
MLPPSLLSTKATVPGSLLLGLVVTAVVYALRARNSPLDGTQVPFLPSIPLLGNTLEVLGNAPRLLDWVADRARERDGQPFAVHLLGKKPLIYTSRPEHFEQVLKTQSSNFDKGQAMHDVYADFMGESILLVNGDRWKFHRKVLVNLFSARALRDVMTPIIQKNVLVLVRILSRASESGDALDFHKLVNKFTLETFAEIGFGRQLGNLTSQEDHPFELAFDDAHHICGNRLTTPSWLWKLQRWLNVGSERRLREAVVVVNAFMMEMVSGMLERRRQDKEAGAQQSGKDVLSIILGSAEADGQAMTANDIRDVVFAGMIAGRDTTADALSWLTHVLHRNPRVVKKLREEILAKIPKLAESDTYVPSMEDVQGLTYLEATLRELLRLFPVAPTIGYHCVRDTVFPDGTLIPADSGIMLSLYAAARLESVWGPYAASFVPERFIDEASGELLHVSSTKLAAFSAGPRMCVGRNLALLELKLVTSCLVGRFDLVEQSGQDVTYRRGVTMGMKNPLMLTVERIPTAESF